MLTAALLTVPWVTHAQTHYTVAVGSGTDSSGYVPTHSWEYNFSQTIVHASEIGLDGVIDTIAFQIGSGADTRQLAIYMAERTQGNYTNGVDVVGGTHFRQVFSGSVTFSPGWVAIALDSTYVRGICTDNTYSDWSPVSSITTGRVGIDDDHLSGTHAPSCTIYPNPIWRSRPNGSNPPFVTVSVSGISGKVRIAIVDITGREVTVATNGSNGTLGGETLDCSGDCAKTINVDNLSQGAYFVRITSENANIVKKLIVR